MPSKKIKKILIAGGAGFLGTHLCRYLIDQGHYVFALDNFSSGHKANLASLITHPRFKCYKRDVIKPFKIEIDEIYNLACPASPSSYQRNPIETLKVSILGSLNLLDLAKEWGAKILQFSTSEIYGDPEIHPQKEDYWGHVNSIGPRACYDEGKRAAEALFFDYLRFHKVPIKIARIFNTYGPFMHPQDGRVISNFIYQALYDQPLTIYGKGHQTRSFCYVDDLIEGCVRFMQTPDEITGPLNLGNPQEHTILELANLCIELSSSQSQLSFKELPVDDPKRRQPDITKAKTLLKWEPVISLREGLLKTIFFFRETLQKFPLSGRISSNDSMSV